MQIVTNSDSRHRLARNGRPGATDFHPRFDRSRTTASSLSARRGIARQASPPTSRSTAGTCWFLPGFIDTHVHNMQQLGRGLADECDLPKQLLQRLYGYEAVLTSEDAYFAAKLCQMELIKAGTTYFLDPSSYYPDETAQAAGETGIRGIVSRTAFDIHRTPIGDMPGRGM